MTSLSTTLVRATYPHDEARHKVRFWNAKGLLFTSSVGGLCYVLTSDGRSYEGCRLVADGQEFTGDEIPRWGGERLPKSLEIAQCLRDGGGDVCSAGHAVDSIASR